MSSQGIFKQVLILVLLSSCAGGLTYWLHAKRPVFSSAQVDEVEIEGQIRLSEIKSTWGFDKVIWIDARTAGAYAAGHIDKAIHLDDISGLADLEIETTARILDRNIPKVVYCGYEDCKASKKLAEALEEKGVLNVHVLQGGYSRWTMREK